MKKQLWLMCGVAGSGKDTWIKEHLHTFNGYTKVVSRDEIRFSLLKEDEDYFSKEKEVYNKYIEEIVDGLKNCDVTIANATHLNEKSRAKLLRNLRNNLKDVEINIMVIRRDLKTCLKQNAGRTGRALVPNDSIKNMYSTFTMPSISEGFDNIWVHFYENGIPRYTIIERGSN